MSFPEPNSEGHFCRRCQEYRTRTAVGLCPSCLDDEKRAEKEAEQCRS